MNHMKRTTARLAAALMIGAAVFSTSGCGKKSGAEMEAIQKTGILKVAIVDTQSVYTSIENGVPVGIEPELAEYIADALGVTAQFQVYQKQEALQALKTGEADIALGCINRIEGAMADYQSSVSYGKGFCYGVTRRGDYATTIGALEESVVGVDVNLDESTRSGLYGASGITLADVLSVEAAEEALKNCDIRAYICYENQAKVLLEDEALQVQNISNLKPEEFAIAVNASDTALASEINVLIPQFLEAE